MNFFSQFFSPVLSTEDTTRKHLLWWLFLRMILWSTLCSCLNLIRDKAPLDIIPPDSLIAFYMIGLYLVSIPSAFCLQKFVLTGGALKFFGAAQLCFDALLVAFFVYGTGCSFSIFTPLFILPIIAAGLILYKPGSLLLAATCTLLYAGLLLLEFYGPELPYFFYENTGYRRPMDPMGPLSFFAFYGLLFFLAALLSGQTGANLHRARQELRKATRAYDQLAQMYRQIFNDISTGIITTDSKNTINSCNHAAATITGYSQEIILGEALERFFPAMAGPPPRVHPVRNVCTFTRQDGATIRIGYSSAPLHLEDEAGADSLAKVITLQDISQIERLERQMHEAEKLAAVGEMSAMVAHDFRNPLAAISGSAQMLAMNQNAGQNEENDSNATLIAIILREAARMEKTIADFLLFARPQAPKQQWFQLRPVLESQISRLLADNKTLPPPEICWEIPVDMLCWADQEQVSVMVRQVVENAWTAAQDKTAHILVRARNVADGETLTIEVGDHGPGIAPELRERVFLPFFSHLSQGTGLGLAIVRQFAQQHEGSAVIDSDEEFSCIVRITLPQPALSGEMH